MKINALYTNAYEEFTQAFTPPMLYRLILHMLGKCTNNTRN